MLGMNVNIEAPWYTFNKKLKALFEKDADIVVSEVYESDGDTDYAFDIEVKNHEKFVALDRLMPSIKVFGNVSLGIVLYDEENQENDVLGLFETLFKGNPIFNSTKSSVDPAGMAWNYVVFNPDVIQFYDDNLADYCGNYNGLAQDVATEVFEENSRGVFFCTVLKDKE